MMEENFQDKQRDGLFAPVTPVKLGCDSAQGSSILSSEANTGMVIEGSKINSSDTSPAKLGERAQASVPSLEARTELVIQGSLINSSDNKTTNFLGNSQIELGLPGHDDEVSCGMGARSGFADDCGGAGKVNKLGKSNCMQPQEPCAGTDASYVPNSQSEFGREDFNFTPDSKQSQKQRGRKRKSPGIDLNKRPRQRLKVKKHRPRIFDASKPKKIPKEKKVRKKADKSEKTPGTKKIPREKKVRKNADNSEQTPGLNAEPLDATKPKPKKIPMGKNVGKKVSKSEKIAGLELDPKTPSPRTPEPLSPEPLSPSALIPTECKGITFEGRNCENNTGQIIGRFSDHGTLTSVCRKSLNFIEDSVENERDDIPNEVVTGGVNNLIDEQMEESNGNVNEVDCTGSDGDVNEVLSDDNDGKVERIYEQIDGNVEQKGYTHHRQRRRGGKGINVFNMLIPLLQEEDFGCCCGMQNVLREYSGRNDTLLVLLKNFPQFFKRRRSKRQRRFYSNINLKMAIKLFNGHRIPTKKRSRTNTKRTCWSLLLPSLVIRRKRSKIRQNLTTNETSVQNLPAGQTPVVQPPKAASNLLVAGVANHQIVSQPVADSHIVSHVHHPEAASNLNAVVDSHIVSHVQHAEAASNISASHIALQPVNQASVVIDDIGFFDALLMSSMDNSRQHHLATSVVYCEDQALALLETIPSNDKHHLPVYHEDQAEFFDAPVMYTADQIQQYNSLADEAEIRNANSNHQIQQIQPHNLSCDDGMLELQIGLPQYQDNKQPSVQDNVTMNVIPGFEDIFKSIDFIMQKFEALQITSGTLVLHKKKIKPIKKHKPVPKVDLDEETLRVWNMLMDNCGSGNMLMDNCGSETTKEHENEEEEKEKWWAKEREIFGKRVNSLIARMHLIQGNRRFSPWKGSVVDSAVGVFLTQNVSDHLSSSAFMELASRFPVAPPADNNDCVEDIPLIQEPVIDEDIASSQESVGNTLIMDVHSQESMGSNDVTKRLTNDAEKKQSSDFQVELDTLQQLEEKKEDSSVTVPDNILLSSVEDARKDQENSPPQEISSCGCSTSQGVSDSISEDKVVLATSFNSSNCHQGVKEKMETMKSANEEKIMESVTNKKKKKAKVKEKKENPVDWDELRRTYSRNRPRTMSTMDSVDWNAVRCATVGEVANIIAVRGMNNILAGRIKDFLNRMVKEHGSIDLEWLRDVPPDKVKDYLLSIEGLGLKSVECVRLLTLHHHAFPVDTNVGRVAVRLGWVPLQPLPGNLEIDLLNQYPLVDSIQKYLWPRLCMLDQRTLYELHYQLITFGKVFCTKKQPNCNACPLKAECKHFASAFARARLRLPGPQEKSIVTANNPCTTHEEDPRSETFPLISLCNRFFSESNPIVEVTTSAEEECMKVLGSDNGSKSCEPVVEFPPSPEPESRGHVDVDIEDLCKDADDEIPPIEDDGDGEALRLTLTKLYEETKKPEFEMALAAINPKASIPTSKLKIIGRLRTVHNAYELPDTHSLLQTFDKREPDDPCPYLLAIWLSGDSTNTVQEKNSEEVSGTIMIPCRTAMRGSFPLNGTYFQVNEVFADDETSQRPIRVSRKALFHLRRRALYCGTSATSIFKGLDTPEIRYCFWKGFVCVRAFNRRTRAPKPLPTRFRPPGGPAKNFKEEYEYDD